MTKQDSLRIRLYGAKLELSRYLSLIEDLRTTARQGDTEQPPQFYLDQALVLEQCDVPALEAEIVALEDEMAALAE